MANTRRFKTATIRLALPVLNGSILRAGADIQAFSPIGDPRIFRVPPPAVFGLRVPYELGRTFFPDYLPVEDVLKNEARVLSQLDTSKNPVVTGGRGLVRLR
jgi:hypothetical protein